MAAGASSSPDSSGGKPLGSRHTTGSWVSASREAPPRFSPRPPGLQTVSVWPVDRIGEGAMCERAMVGCQGVFRTMARDVAGRSQPCRIPNLGSVLTRLARSRPSPNADHSPCGRAAHESPTLWNGHLEEDAMATAGSHPETWPKILTFAADGPAGREVFHGVALGDQVALGALPTPGSLGVAPDRLQIRASALGQFETPHRSAKKASI
jgi:hypothetical protein